MIVYTPRANQGQIVTVSYGWHDGLPYRRVHDASDQTIEWYVGHPDWEQETESMDYERAPHIIGEWTRCDAPDEVAS